MELIPFNGKNKPVLKLQVMTLVSGMTVVAEVEGNIHHYPMAIYMGQDGKIHSQFVIFGDPESVDGSLFFNHVIYSKEADFFIRGMWLEFVKKVKEVQSGIVITGK